MIWGCNVSQQHSGSIVRLSESVCSTAEGLQSNIYEVCVSVCNSLASCSLKTQVITREELHTWLLVLLKAHLPDVLYNMHLKKHKKTPDRCTHRHCGDSKNSELDSNELISPCVVVYLSLCVWIGTEINGPRSICGMESFAEGASGDRK